MDPCSTTDIPPAYTFDDVLMIPAPPRYCFRGLLATRLTDSIPQAPMVSAAMDTVTEHRRHCHGREGDRHYPQKHAKKARHRVERVKKSESGMIIDPVTVTRSRAWPMSGRHAQLQDSGLPVLRGDKLVGIVTNRDCALSRTTTCGQGCHDRKNLVTARWHQPEHSKACSTSTASRSSWWDDNGRSRPDHHQGYRKDQEIPGCRQDSIGRLLAAPPWE